MAAFAGGDIFIAGEVAASGLVVVEQWRSGVLLDTLTSGVDGLPGVSSCFDADRNLYVPSQGFTTSGVLKWTPDGSYAGIFGGPYNTAYTSAPVAVSADDDGNIYVLNGLIAGATGDYPLLRKFDSAGTLLTTFDLHILIGGQIEGLAVWSDGSKAVFSYGDFSGSWYIEELNLSSLVQTNLVTGDATVDFVVIGIRKRTDGDIVGLNNLSVPMAWKFEADGSGSVQYPNAAYSGNAADIAIDPNPSFAWIFDNPNFVKLNLDDGSVTNPFDGGTAGIAFPGMISVLQSAGFVFGAVIG